MPSCIHDSTGTSKENVLLPNGVESVVENVFPSAV
jgi:hypothetical protein